jgi:alkanesulfonate monooxygenase SsuD/methylene tetrahydromethanopterin reductase-like flavin-dependent oxidoreductase (luciferase family)
MRFGLAVVGNQSKNHPPEANFELILEMVQTARDTGFDVINAGHHYLVEDHDRFQAIPTLSRASAESGDLSLAACQILPLHHPVEIAEHMATLDVMSGGRAILAPIAGYRDVEFDAFGVSKSERGRRIKEGVEIIKRLWTEDDVSYDGEVFSIENCSINPKPIQEPRPPIWIGGESDAAIRRATDTGDAWYAYVQANTDESTLAHRLDVAGKKAESGSNGVQPVAMNTFVGPTDEAAVEIYRPILEDTIGWYEEEGYQGATGGRTDLDKDGFSPFLVGGPDTVADQIVYLAEEHGINCLISGMIAPGLDREHVLRSVELMGEEVIPIVETRLDSA